MALERLIAELRAYCAAHNLASLSADELQLEIDAVLSGGMSPWVSPPETAERETELRLAVDWLGEFCTRWDAAESCSHNGHRDSGRGVCAECGEFLE